MRFRLRPQFLASATIAVATAPIRREKTIVTPISRPDFPPELTPISLPQQPLRGSVDRLRPRIGREALKDRPPLERLGHLSQLRRVPRHRPRFDPDGQVQPPARTRVAAVRREPDVARDGPSSLVRDPAEMDPTDPGVRASLEDVFPRRPTGGAWRPRRGMSRGRRRQRRRPTTLRR